MPITFSSSGTKAPLGIGGRLFVSLFFMFFLGMGCLFVVQIGREALADLRTWTWVRTDCEIIRSGVRETDRRGKRTGEFYLELEYRYSFNGRLFSSDRPKLKPTGFSDYGKVERLAETYRAGSHTVCYVNPSAPADAVLERGNLLFPLAVLFPLIFVTIGIGGIYAAWRPGSTKPGVVRPISDRANGAFGQRFALLFLVIFTLVGGLIFYFVSARPLFRILSARQWPAVPCSVIFSEIKSHRGDHGGNTYSVNILYSYVFNDREYKANQYDFMGGSSSGFSGKQAIVSRYSRGSKQLCYVNPGDPTEAVLVRGFTPMMWIGVVPLLFVGAGLLGLVSTLRKMRGPAFSATVAGLAPSIGTSGLAVVPQPGASHEGAPLRLRPSASPTGKLFGTIIFALFWNGMVSVFVVQLFKHWRAGYFEWFLALFLCPFVLVGLGLMAAVVYFLLGFFNPRPHLTLTPCATALGQSLRVDWDIAGRVDVLQNLRLRLQGREEATYTRGTRTSTDRSVFADLEIASVTQFQGMRSGSGSLIIPATLMHSFASQHNKITWSIRIQGEIPHWPDLDEEFPVTVLPAIRSLNDQI